MKNIKTFSASAICGALLTFAITATAGDLKQGVATVVRVKGQASYTLGGTDGWHPLVPGKILTAGATISTKPEAIVDVVLGKQAAMPQAQPSPDRISLAPDSPVTGQISCKPAVEQNVVRLAGGTTLKIDSLTVSDTGVDTVSDTELDLQGGRIFASVKKLSEDSKYLVKVPNGIAGVRGTQFTMGVSQNENGSPTSDIGCVKHAVWFAGAGSPPVEVAQGTQYNSATGQSGPMSPETLSQLEAVGIAATSTYEVTTSYAVNLAQILQVSTLTGYYPQ